MSDVISTKQSALSTAVMLAAIGAVENASEGAKIGAVEKRERARLELENENVAKWFTPLQFVAVDSLCELAFEYDEARTTYRHDFTELVAQIWPGAVKIGTVDRARYDIVYAVLRDALDRGGERDGQYPLELFRTCVKARNGGEVPKMASGKTKKPKYSAKTWVKGFDSGIDALIAKVAKAPKGNIDGDAFKRLVSVMRELAACRKELDKRIAAK